MEGGDYKLINKEGWNELVNSFGIVNGQEPLKRSVIEHGLFSKETKVEIYPLHLKLCLFNSLEKIIDKDISKSTTLGKRQFHYFFVICFSKKHEIVT